MSIKGLRGITINTSWEGITLAGISPLIDKMKEIGFNLIKVDIPITEIRNITAFKAMLQKAHSLGIKIHLFMNISRYAGSFNTFHTNAAARSAFMSDLDFVILNYPDLDGIELEEPYLHYVPTDPAISSSARAFFNAFFVDIRTKLNAKIGTGFDYGFNNATETLSSNMAMGLDVGYIASHQIFTYYNDQNSNDDMEKFKAQISLYRNRFPNLEISETCYLTTTTLLKNTYPGGRCSAKAPGTMSPSYANVACWNQFVYDQIEYLDNNNISFCVFTSHRLNVSGAYWINGIASNTPAVRITGILRGNTQPPIVARPGYTLVFDEDFNDPATIRNNWDIIKDTSPSSISVANSIMTMNVAPGGNRALGPWIRHKTKTWQKGLMVIRLKPSDVTGQRSGEWGYRNNRKPCQNSPTMASQDSVNLEFTVSSATYTEPNGSKRVAGHLTANYSIWNDVKCNQYFLVDSPDAGRAFHEYEFEWNDTEVIFRIDGIVVKRYTQGIPTAPIDINIALELAVTDITWMDQTPSTRNAIQEVDYIRIYQKDGTPPPATTGSLDISSIPPDALVYVDGLYKGITNVLIEGLAPGTRTIKLTKTGFDEVDGTALIQAGTIQMQEYTLIPSHGTLFISSIPVADATVFLDNEDTLQVTPAVLLVSPGIHSIKLVRSGFNDAIELNIPVEADQTISKIYTLLPLSGNSAGTVITVSTGLAAGATLYKIGKLLQR